MFKQDEYIVILTGGDNSDQKYTDTFPNNYIFKQNQEGDYLHVYRDAQSKTTNGRQALNPKNIEFTWRYGTLEEIRLYEEWQKPYDTRIRLEIGSKVIALDTANDAYGNEIFEGQKFIVEDLIDKGDDTLVYFKDTPGIYHAENFIRDENI